MLKKKLFAVLLGIAILVAASGGGGILADAVGLDLTPTVNACVSSGSSGGGSC